MDCASLPFQLFGSADSTDTDVMVFVSEIGQPHTSVALAKQMVTYLRESYAHTLWATRDIDINLAILEDGIVTRVYKGTADEVNNSLIQTYKFHEQPFQQLVKVPVARDVTIKILRAFRGMLSLVSRTEFRTDVKNGLHGDVYVQLDVLSRIPISVIHDLGSKNMSMVDYYKVIAFQLGQAIGLLQGVELYTKQEISESFPDLKPFLYRESGNISALDYYQALLIELVTDYVPNMYALRE